MSNHPDTLAYQRQLIEERLGKLHEKQVAFFHRLHPGGVKDDQLDNALRLIDSTIKKNENDSPL